MYSTTTGSVTLRDYLFRKGKPKTVLAKPSLLAAVPNWTYMLTIKRTRHRWSKTLKPAPLLQPARVVTSQPAQCEQTGAQRQA
ncbi:MAG: hypothetical protein ABIM50_00940, partial [Novosphingobium sp.]